MKPFCLAIYFAVAVVVVAAEINTKGARDPNKLNVHVVCHTHDDAGWLKTLDQYYYGAKNNIQVAGVQYILTSVMQALRDNPDRKFVYAEMAFFTKWWKEQSQATKELVKELVKNGQLDFVGGGFVQHDEAASHYVSMVDQTSYGHRFLNRTFGKVPRVAWQLDPFGHSATQASLMTAAAGYEGLVFGRADYQDLSIRRNSSVQAMEFVWRGSQTWGASADSFTHINMDANYSPFPGMNFEWGNFDQPIIDDPESPDYNVGERVNWTVAVAQQQSASYRGNDVLFMEGTDFTYANANSWFINLDKLIHHVNKDGRINMFYSSPQMFMDAKKSWAAAGGTLPLKLDDFFPYADCPHCYWTGYFVSRPTHKGFTRQASSFLQAARQLDVLAHTKGDADIESLEAAVSLCHHHDSITGTEKQAVANDYARRLYLGWQKAFKVFSKGLNQVVRRPADRTPAAAAGIHPAAATRKHLLPGVANPMVQEAAASRKLRSADAVETTLADGGDARSDALTTSFEFEQCMLLNASICGPSVAAISAGQDVMVTLYNALAWPRTEWIRIPTNRPLTVLAGDCTTQVESVALPISSSTQALQGALASTSLFTNASEVGSMEVVFKAEIPAMGHQSFILKGAASEEAPKVVPRELPVGDDDVVTISFGKLSLSYTKATGRLQSISAADGSWQLPATHSLMWYNASDGQEAENQGTASGAYLFRPSGNSMDAQEIAVTGPVKLTVASSDLVSEVTQEFAPWASVTTRLFKDADYIEMEWTVGPIPGDDKWGKEIISRFSTNLATAGSLLTDANGREMLRRRRNFRPSWSLEVHEPAAGNYYPITSSAIISDGKVTMSLATERAQGAASVADGQLEVMVHRRLTHDDGRGVGESLSESMCGCNTCPADGCQCSCMPLIARGTHRIVVGPAAGANRKARLHAQLLNDPPVLAFWPIPSGTDLHVLSKQLVANGSALALKEGIPENVHLLTLMQLDEDWVLLRLAHTMQAGEDDELAQPVMVDLRLIAGAHVSEMTELALSGALLRRDQPPSNSWPISGGMTDNPARAFGDDSTPTFDIRRHPNDSGMIIELLPMEIRTFRLRTGRPSPS